MTKRVRILRKLCLAVLLAVAVSATFDLRAQTNVTLTATTSPTAAQPGITTVSVTGSNFPSGTIAPSDVTLTIQPATAGAGPTVSTVASALATVVGTTRRVTFTVPGSFAVIAPVAYRVTLAGRTTAGTTFVSSNAASLTINPPPSISSLSPGSAATGATATIAITTAYTNFVQGATQANFGPGIAVGGAAEAAYGFVTVTSPTTATAQIVVSSTAAAGFHHVSVRTGVQEASRDNVFSVTSSTPTNRPPAANAGGPYSGAPGQAIQFDGRGSSDPDHDPLTYAWQFGDNQTGTGPTPTHAYAAAGQYVVTLTVTDPSGASNTATTSATITRPNRTPTANAGGPYSGQTGAALTFDGSASSDPDGDALTYAWNFGDGTPAASGVTPTHAYVNANTYAVTLTVTDPSGASNTATTSATITRTNHTPIANPGGPYSGQTGTAVSFDGSASTDPDGDALTYSWNFGDGSAPSTAVKPSHVYANANTYTVALTVTDPSGASNTATVNATITRTNHTPTANPGGPYSGQTTAAVTFDGSGSTDPDGDTLTYSWDFGDGTPKSSEIKPSHTYAAANTYTVALTVTDPSGASNTATVNAAITQGNRTPTANPGGPYAGQTTTAVAFDGTGSSDPDGDALTYSWNFGDGSALSTQASPSHVYTASGPYLVTLTVQDGRGGQGTATTTAQISKANGKPTARATGPSAGDAGTTLAFRGADSTDPDGDPLTFSWDFGDGSTKSTQTNPSHAFAQAGPYVVALTVTDSFGASDTATVSVTVSVPNHKPTAVPGGPYSAQSGAAVAFDGSASTDPDGDALIYSWDFGDGGAKSSVAKPTHSFSAGGNYTVSLTVTDTHGASDTATVVAAVTGANQPPTANAGGPYTGEAGVAVAIDGSQSMDPDGTALTFSWDFGDGSPKGSGAKPSHVYAATGTFAVSLTVTDPGGLTAAASTTANVTTSVDRVPPVVSLTGAKQALPGSQVVVTADATDNVAVSSVTLTVNDADPVSYTTGPYQRTINVPDVAAPGTEIHVHALAKDPSNNEGAADHTITIVALPDTSKPTVTLTVPPQAAAGSSILVTADAQDNVAVTGVDFTQNTSPIGSAAHAPYQIPYVVPVDAAIGSVLTFGAQATDAAGNRAQATATLTVVGVGDVDATPPDVSVSAPSPAVSGTSITLTATAADVSGIASVTFYVDGAKVATSVTPPYQAPYSIATSVAAGTRLHVEARAVNGLALEAAATTSVDVVSPSQGVLTGAVFDDAIGLPVAGASVQLIGKDARGLAYTQTAVSDSRGQYVLKATEGDAIVSIAKPGWTRLDRAVSIEPATALHVVDARLTNTGLVSAPIPAAVGGTLASPATPFLAIWQRDLLTLNDPYVTALAASSPTVALNIAAGALSTDATLALTPVSRQGLAGLLPAGWTPIAAADVAPHGVSFLAPVPLTVPLPLPLAAGTPLTLARWDDDARAWRTVALTTVETGAKTLAASLDSTGQFVWLVADTVPAPPPPSVVGDLVPGVDAALIPADATAIVDPQPKIIFYKPGVKSDVRGRVTTTAPLSSGTLARTRILESYDFFSGAHMQLDPTLEDVVLYQVPGSGGKTLVAGYPVAPSLTFEALSLQKGVITVELRAPGARQETVQLIDETGGSVASSTGERIDVSAGAMAGPLPVTIGTLTSAEIGVPAPDGFDIVGAVLLDFANVLAAPATVSVPRTAQVLAGDLILVARMQELVGQTRFVTIGLGTIQTDRISSSTLLAGSTDTFEGVRKPGRYVFLRAKTTLGFSTGLVNGTDGAPFPGAMISQAPTSPLVAVSQGTGRYISTIPLGGATLTARNPIMGDSASGTATATSPRQVVTLDFGLVAHFPTVTSVNPQNGAEGVPLSGPIAITFSTPIDPATATSASITLTSSAGAVLGRREISNGNTVVTFRTTEALSPNTVYTLTVTRAVTDPFGRALTAQYSTSFTSLNTIAPPPPPAGSVSASIPVNGNTTVTVSQGAAGSKDTVLIRNVTRGTITPIGVVDPSVGFTVQVAAGITDLLQLVIKDRSGNETVVALPAFRNVNADGSISQAVSKAGGHIDGPAGIGVDVKAGTFPDGAVVTVSAATETDFPLPLLTDQQKQNFKFSGALKLDYGGKKPQSYLNVSIPAAPDDNEANRWIVVRQMPFNGETLYDIADTARVIDGRIATSSPPCPGVSAAAVYGFLKANREVTVLTGAGGVIANPEALNDTYLLAAETGYVDLSPGNTASMPGMVIAGTENALGELLLQAATTCVPVLSGKVTAVPNQMNVAINPAAFIDADVEVVVTNSSTTHPGEPHHLYRPFPANVNIEGGSNDPVTVQALALDGTPRSIDASFITKSSRSFVLVSIPNVNGDYRSIVVENLQNGKRLAEPFARDTSGGVLQPVHAPMVKLLIEGTMTDPLDIYAVTDAGVRVTLTASVAPYDAGGGNIVFTGLRTSIDPTPDEIDAYNATLPPGLPRLDRTGGAVRAVIVVKQLNPATGKYIPTGATVTVLDVDAGINKVADGGFRLTYDDTLDHRYELVETLLNGRQDSTPLPTFHVTVTSHNTKKTVRELLGPIPPKYDSVVINPYGPGAATPTLKTLTSAFEDVDPSAPIELRFSAPIDRNTALAALKVVIAGTTTPVDGTIVFDNDVFDGIDSIVRFIPKNPLPLGSVFTLKLVGVRDLLGRQISPRSLTITTYTPTVVSTYSELNLDGTPLPFDDLQVIHDTDGAGNARTTLAATSGNENGFKLHTIDVSDAVNPVERGQAGGGHRTRRLALETTTTFTIADIPIGCSANVVNLKFTGNLAMGTASNTDDSSLMFYDVTNPAAPCTLGTKKITTNPAVSGAFQHGTFRTLNSGAGGGAFLKTTTGYAAYMAIRGVGLAAVDVGKNIPGVAIDARETEGLYAGDYTDVIAVAGDRLFALNNNNGSGSTLDVFDPNLSLISSVAVDIGGSSAGGTQAHQLAYASDILVDKNGDGQFDDSEVFAFAYVGGRAGITIVDVSDPDNPAPITTFPVGGLVRQVAVSPDGRRLYVGGANTGGGGDQFSIVDVSNPFAPVTQRVIYTKPYAEVDRVQVDSARPYVYVATTGSIDTIATEGPNLAGTLSYDRYPVDINATDPLNPSEFINYSRGFVKPIRGAVVELRNASRAVIARSHTTVGGYFSFHAPKNAHLLVTVKSELGPQQNPDVRVVDLLQNGPCPVDEPDCLVYQSEFPVVTTSNRVDVELLVTSGWNGTAYSSATDRKAGPFAILDTAFEAGAFLRTAAPNLTLPKLTFDWNPFASADPNAESHFSASTGVISLKGQENVDTDEYDRVVILHEYGHYLLRLISRDDTLAGTHDAGNCLWQPFVGCRPQDHLDPTTAFSEGFATGFAGIVVQSNPGYIDTAICDASGCNSTPDIYYVDAVGQGQAGNGVGFHPINRNWGNKGFDSETSISTVVMTVGTSLGPGSFGFVQTALQSMAQSTAFTSISSFLKYLRDAAGPALTASVINPTAIAEGMPITDEFGPASIYAPDNPVVVDGDTIVASTTVTPQPTPGGPTDTYTGNKLGNHVYFTLFDPAVPRPLPNTCYDLQVTADTNPDRSTPTLSIRVPQKGASPQILSAGATRLLLDGTTHVFEVGALATALGDRAATFRVLVRFKQNGACP